MAQETIDALMITQFSAMMHIKAQQLKARLRPWVEMKEMTGDVYAYDGLGTVEARELTGRFNQTQFDSLEHFRRQMTRRRFSVTLPIDKIDLKGMLLDPQGQYATAALHAMERVFDRVVVDAMFASVNTGRTFGTAVTAVADGVLTVDATAGLTLAKLLLIRQNFMDGEVGNDIPINIAVGISGDEHTTLLQIDQLISSRYTNQFYLEKGVIKTAIGYDLVVFGDTTATNGKPILPIVAGVRNSFAMAYGAICVGMSQNWEISVKDRPDYVDTQQVQIVGTLGSVRTEGKLIQQLNTTT